jgi:radical SAM superfamily enzyme YgiQ (UPF0313 family)
MKVLFVWPIVRPEEPPYHIPFSLAQIAAVSESLGHACAFLDVNAHRFGLDVLRAEARADEFDVVAISGLTSQYKYIKQYLPILREVQPNALIVAGGGFITSQPYEMMKFLPQIDVACIGEGENTWVEICDHVFDRRFEEVRGVIFRDEKGNIKMTEPRPLIGMKDSGLYESLDDLPYPAYDLLPMDVYLRNSQIPLCPETMRPDLRRISITHERGCPFMCRFCTHLGMSATDLARIYGREFKGWPVVRRPSPKYYIEHIKYLRMKFCVNFISILDENFLADKKFCLEFADLMEKEGLVGLVRFGILGHPVSADPQVISRLRDVGCSYISWGAESADQKILDALNKHSSPEAIQNAIDTCMKFEVYPITTWMVTPNDTPETVLKTIRFWKRNQITCKPFYETAYPGTELFETYKDKIIDYFLEDEEKELIKKLEDEGRKGEAEEIKLRGLERYVERLGDATDLVVNLNPNFNELEMLGLQHAMFEKDERRILKWAKLKLYQVDLA